MNHRWNLLYILAPLVVLPVPTAHGAVDLHQYGLTGSWYKPRTSGQGFVVEVFPDLFSPAGSPTTMSLMPTLVNIQRASSARTNSQQNHAVAGAAATSDDSPSCASCAPTGLDRASG